MESEHLRFLVFQHHDEEHPGSFREMMAADGTWDVVRLNAGESIPELERFDALLAFGGPMDVWQEAEFPWLKLEKIAIRDFVLRLDRPYLGVCLGHQLLADSLGGEVGKMTVPEVGVRAVDRTIEGAADQILGLLPDTFPTVQWHGAEVKSLPPNSTVLAENSACQIQAFRTGKFAYGIQYHVEVEPATVSEWGKIPEYRCTLSDIAGGNAQSSFERAATASMASFLASAHKLYGGFRELALRSRTFRDVLLQK
jgi:GMP synthase-like glutamine amidotransferase